MSTKNPILTDKVVTRCLNLFEAISGSMDVEKLLKEAKTLHLDRPSRKLYSIGLEPSKIHTAIMKDLSARSRLTELRVALYDNRSSVEAALSEGRAHVMTKFSEEIKGSASNAAGRKALLDKVFASGVSLLGELTATDETLELYIKDCDQAQWSLRASVDILKCVSGEKRGGVV